MSTVIIINGEPTVKKDPNTGETRIYVPAGAKVSVESDCPCEGIKPIQIPEQNPIQIPGPGPIKIRPDEE